MIGERSVVSEESKKQGRPPESSLLTSYYASQLCFSLDQFDAYFLSPEQFKSLAAWVGSVRARTFRHISPHGPNRVDLDGRDDHYWHLLVWDREQQTLAGSLRMALSGWRPFPADSPSSYLEHCYPGLDEHLRANGMAYAEIGRTFVSRPYQRCTPVLMVLLQAMASIPQTCGHFHLMGMVSYNHFAHPDALNRDFLAALMKPPFRDSLEVPTPRHPIADLPTQPEIAQGRSLTELESELIERYKVPFRVPVLLRRYFQFGNAHVVNLSLAKDFNQITEILLHCDLAQLRPRQHERFVVSSLKPVWQQQPPPRRSTMQT
jgi:hypothetical protein